MAAVSGLALPGLASAVRSSLRLVPLADDLALVEGAGAPVVVAVSGRELLLVDGGLAAHSGDLLRLLAQHYPGARVRWLLNTHWHWDRTGANEVLAGQGARLIAQENTRLWLGTEVRSTLEPRVYPPRPARALPGQTFFDGIQALDFGEQALEYALLPQAHTDGDLYVYFPRQNVLVAGDVASGRRYPVLDTSTNGWIGGMVSALTTLMARCDADTRVIGASGAVLRKADLLAQQDVCFAVLTRIGQSYYKGETWAQFQASAPTKEFDAAWGDPAQFLRAAYEGAWNHVNEIRRVTR
jgi:glyoxylase-like metal-dependent hydrolase (beta-lactamase superfamily II)